MNVHYEACTHLNRTIHEIHEEGMKAGVTLNPSTPVCMLEDCIQDVDMVLLMSVNPGFGGQKFIENTYAKIGRLRKPDQGQRLTGSYRSGWWCECRDSAEAQARRRGCARQRQLCV